MIVVDDGSTDATPAIAREYGVSGHQRTATTASVTPATWGFARRRARSSPTSTTTPIPTRTGCAIWRPASSSTDARRASAARTSRRPVTARSPSASPTPRAVRSTSCCPTRRPSTSRAATWRSAEAALLAIGGFDPQFRTAGDDVDVCWRLRERGWTLGFSPAPSCGITGGTRCAPTGSSRWATAEAEALLERKWPEKYNGAGHLSWAGRLYGPGLAQAMPWRRDGCTRAPGARRRSSRCTSRRRGPSPRSPLMPEWYLAILVLALLSALGSAWPPLLVALPLLGLGGGSAPAPGDARRGARPLHLSRPIVQRAAQALRPDGAPVPPPAVGAAAWPSRPRPGAVATARHCSLGLTLAADRCPLAPARTHCGGAPGRHQPDAPRSRRGRPSRWRFRSLGPRGATRRAWRGAGAHGNGGARRRPSAPAVPHPAVGATRVAGPRHLRLRRRARRVGQPGLDGGAEPGHRRGSGPRARVDRQRPSRRGRPAGAGQNRGRWRPRRIRSRPGRRPSSGWPDRDRTVPPPAVPLAPLEGPQRRGGDDVCDGRAGGPATLAHQDPGRPGPRAGASAGAPEPGRPLAARPGRPARTSVLGVRLHRHDLLRRHLDDDGDHGRVGATRPAHGLRSRRRPVRAPAAALARCSTAAGPSATRSPGSRATRTGSRPSSTARSCRCFSR